MGETAYHAVEKLRGATQRHLEWIRQEMGKGLKERNGHVVCHEKLFRRLAEGNERGFWARIIIPPLEFAANVYGFVGSMVRSLYEKGVIKEKNVPFPVVSVGNLTWGGTGKTPLVEYLARKTSERGVAPLVLTRGYSHDEVEQLKRQLPRVVIGVGKKSRSCGA